MRTGGWRGRCMGQRKNGEYLVLWGNISAVRDAGGTVSRYVWVITDASSQTEAQPA